MKNTRGSKLCSDSGISQEHEGEIESTIKYMETHRIQELFNELLTRVLDERPDDAKYRIIQLLKTVQKIRAKDKHMQRVYQIMDQPNAKGPGGDPTDCFLTPEDFESLFDSYDIFQTQSVPVTYLAQAMNVVGVVNPQQVLLERYKEICRDEFVNKVSFTYILQEEHMRLGFSFEKM